MRGTLPSAWTCPFDIRRGLCVVATRLGRETTVLQMSTFEALLARWTCPSQTLYSNSGTIERTDPLVEWSVYLAE